MQHVRLNNIACLTKAELLTAKLPTCMMSKITKAWDYFHAIVCVPGCVTHEMPNPVVSQCLMPKDPIAGQTGTLKPYEGVTSKHKPQQLVLKPTNYND